jgi:carbamoylphosphate synthase large subunit
MVVKSVEEGVKYAKQSGYPIVVKRHSLSLAVPMGTVTDEKELLDLLKRTLESSCIKEAYLESLFK